LSKRLLFIYRDMIENECCPLASVLGTIERGSHGRQLSLTGANTIDAGIDLGAQGTAAQMDEFGNCMSPAAANAIP
jgi:hypothetical protein